MNRELFTAILKEEGIEDQEYIDWLWDTRPAILTAENLNPEEIRDAAQFILPLYKLRQQEKEQFLGDTNAKQGNQRKTGQE